ncbi:hypothetical protein ACIO6U_32755 [Streptomyces sp. NPDC087422]|uniref:hypothetical protein n=1 Tax=Streptomyces sp. NPDC087422 TaxID=3365786 RepID=UPI0037FD70D1
MLRLPATRHPPPATRHPLPATRGKAGTDWLGIVLMTFALSSVVLAGTWAGNRYAWASWRIGPLAVAAALGLAAFVASQRRAADPSCRCGCSTPATSGSRRC